jgi:hypothetical protein
MSLVSDRESPTGGVGVPISQKLSNLLLSIASQKSLRLTSKAGTTSGPGLSSTFNCGRVRTLERDVSQHGVLTPLWERLQDKRALSEIRSHLLMGE